MELVIKSEDVIKKFKILTEILSYIVTRMENHAMIYSNIRGNPVLQFIVYLEDLNCEKEELEWFLDFLANGNKDPDMKEIFQIIRYTRDKPKEYTIIVDNKHSIGILQNWNYNFALIKDDVYKQALLLEYIKLCNNNKQLLSNWIATADMLSYEKQGAKDLYSILSIQKKHPAIKNNEGFYYQSSSLDKIVTKEESTLITKVRLRGRCKELILQKIPEYIKNGHEGGGFKGTLYEDTKSEIQEEYPICKTKATLFTRNLFNTTWDEIIKENPKYESLSKRGRRY